MYENKFHRPLFLGAACALMAFSLLGIAPAAAQQKSPQQKPAEQKTAPQKAAAQIAGPERNALLFDKLCYEMLPNLAGLQGHATKMKWEAITGRRLQAFALPAKPKILKAWKFKDFNVPFQIAITQSDMDAQGKKDFPGFANAQVYACSLILPAKFPRAQISTAMKKLMGRKPDETSDQGRLKFDTWQGQDKTRKVIINHMGAKTGGPGGMLSITLMLKPK